MPLLKKLIFVAVRKLKHSLICIYENSYTYIHCKYDHIILKRFMIYALLSQNLLLWFMHLFCRFSNGWKADFWFSNVCTNSFDTCFDEYSWKAPMKPSHTLPLVGTLLSMTTAIWWSEYIARLMIRIYKFCDTIDDQNI